MRRRACQVSRRHLQVICQSRVFASRKPRNRLQLFAVDLAVVVKSVDDVPMHDLPEYEAVAKSAEFDDAIEPTFEVNRRPRKARRSYDAARGKLEPKRIDFA